MWCKARTRSSCWFGITCRAIQCTPNPCASEVHSVHSRSCLQYSLRRRLNYSSRSLAIDTCAYLQGSPCTDVPRLWSAPRPPPTVAFHRADRSKPLPVAACFGAMWLYLLTTLVLLPPVCIATGVGLGFVVICRYHCHVPARSNARSLAGHNAHTRGVGKGTAAAAMLLGLLLIGALSPICSATPRLDLTRTHTPHARTNVDPIALPASPGAHAIARLTHCSPTYLISHGTFGVSFVSWG